MASLKITFYKEFPYNINGERVPYFFAEQKYSEIYTAFERYKHVEYNINGDFTPCQEILNVQNFSEVNGCNYVRVEVVGEYVKFYAIRDIIALSEIERNGRYYRPAQVLLKEDILMSNFYQEDSATGNIVIPNISGNLIQTNAGTALLTPEVPLKKYSRSLPLSPIYNDGQQLVNAYLTDVPRTYVIMFTFALANNTIMHGIALSKIDNFNYTGLGELTTLTAIKDISSISKVDIKIGKFETGSNAQINILNVYILPYEWVREKVTILLPSEKFNCATTDGTLLSAYQFTVLNNNKGLLFCEKVTPNVLGNYATEESYFLKTANSLIPLKWDGGEIDSINAPYANIYMEYVGLGLGSDSITITAVIGDNSYDITQGFKADIAINQQALQMSQNKTSAVLGALTGVVGSAITAGAGIASGNLFKAGLGITGAVGTIAGIASISENLKKPAAMLTNGSAPTALGMYGLITVLKLQSPTNKDEMQKEELTHGLIYTQLPYLTNIEKLIKPTHYIKASNVEFKNALFGLDIAEALRSRFAQGIRFLSVANIENE